jgi:hypothetical protein
LHRHCRCHCHCRPLHDTTRRYFEKVHPSVWKAILSDDAQHTTQTPSPAEITSPATKEEEGARHPKEGRQWCILLPFALPIAKHTEVLSICVSPLPYCRLPTYLLPTLPTYCCTHRKVHAHAHATTTHHHPSGATRTDPRNVPHRLYSRRLPRGA